MSKFIKINFRKKSFKISLPIIKYNFVSKKKRNIISVLIGYIMNEEKNFKSLIITLTHFPMT